MRLDRKRQITVLGLALAAAAAFFVVTADDASWSALATEATQLHAAGQFKGALAKAEEALRIAERRTLFRPAETSRSLAIVAGLQRDLGRQQEAEANYLRAIEVGKRSSLHPDYVADAECALADLYRDRVEYAKAEPLFRSSLEVLERHRGPTDRRLGRCLYEAASLDQGLNRSADAQAKFRRALGILEHSLGPMHLDVGMIHAHLGMAALDERAYAESADHYSRSLAIFRTHLPPEHPYVAHGLASLGMVYRAQGRHAEAETLLRQSLDLTYRAGRSDHPDLARTLAALGIALMAQGRLDEAEPMFQQAEAIYRKAFGPESPYFTSVVRWHDELRRRRAG